MAYRPRYLDQKRNQSFKKEPKVVKTSIINGRFVVEYSTGHKIVFTKDQMECFDSNEVLKWWCSAEGRFEIYG